MDEMVAAYLSYFNRQVAPSTALRVRYQLRALIQFLKSKRISLTEIGRETIALWLKTLRARGHKPCTVQSEMLVVHWFLRWLYREGYLLVNPWPEGWEAKRLYTLRHVPKEKAVLAMFDRVAQESLCPLRDLCVLELAYGCGLRRAELWRLNVADIRGDFLRILGKGGKERLVPLGSKAKAALWQYIRTERQRKVARHNPAEEALLVSWLGGRLGLAALSHLVKRRRRGSKITLHGFRHACATHMLKNGASIRVIQKLLGHTRLDTTQIYARLDNTDLRKVLENHHPRG